MIAIEAIIGDETTAYRRSIRKVGEREDFVEPVGFIPAKGDRVQFESNGVLLTGTVFVVDSRGGGVCYGVCPSCDVIADDDTLYKHIPLSKVAPLSNEQK